MNDIVINVVLPILSILIPVFVTVYTVNKRIRESNRENHQPYLALKKVEKIDKINVYSYYLTLITDEIKENNIDVLNNQTNINKIPTEILLRNIGYGVATNIKFYNLQTSEQLLGLQEQNIELNQKLFTTFDLESSKDLSIQLNILSSDVSTNSNINHGNILGIYKDLNGNVFDFIISINIKSDDNYDFYSYQPSSMSYQKVMKQYKKQYKMIKKRYMD